MGKILGSWSGMRKYLEQEMLTPSLQGRLRYNCTTYVKMDGCHIIEVWSAAKSVDTVCGIICIENEGEKFDKHRVAIVIV